MGQYPWYWDNKTHQPGPPWGGWGTAAYGTKMSQLITSLKPHFFIEPRWEPMYGPKVPPGWEPTILGYMPMDSTSDIEAQIDQLEKGIAADQLLAKTEQGKDFKVWIETKPHLTPEEIADIKLTISNLKNRKYIEEYGSQTEGGMRVETWLKQNIMVTEEDLRFFWGDHEYITYQITVEFWKTLKNRYINCLAQNYPITPKVKQRIIQTPKGPADWPGIPMQELKLPEKNPFPVRAPGPGEVKLHLTFTMRTRTITDMEGLISRIEIF